MVIWNGIWMGQDNVCMGESLFAWKRNFNRKGCDCCKVHSFWETSIDVKKTRFSCQLNYEKLIEKLKSFWYSVKIEDDVELQELFTTDEWKRFWSENEEEGSIWYS